MTETAAFTKDELKMQYPDQAWQAKLIELYNLRELYANCIIGAGYRIPDNLNTGIVLTAAGQSLRQELVTKHAVPAKEAQLICFLELTYRDIFVDINATDIDKVKRALDSQIKKKELRYPFIFGRELYDRAATLHPDLQSVLDVQETVELLEGTSPGVFQMGNLVVGPYGLLESRENRLFEPTTLIPLFHCPDLTCGAVHRCHLTTDRDATINAHRSKAYKIMESRGEKRAEWVTFLDDLLNANSRMYDDTATECVVPLIGDSFTDDELRSVVGDLLDNATQGVLRGALERINLRGRAAAIVSERSRAELLQIILLCTDDEITRTLNRQISTEVISIPAGEIRKPMMCAQYRFGYFQLQAQANRLGLRIHSTARNLAQLRLRRLVEGLYLRQDSDDFSELEWQLRHTRAADPEARLDEYVRTIEPEEVVRQLVLTRRTNTIEACTLLGIDEHEDLPDHALIATILWRLGFDNLDSDNEHERLWHLHSRMRQIAQSAGVGAMTDRDSIRAVASNYFVALEEVLQTSLFFSAWSLLNDHIASAVPFHYQPDETLSRVVEWMNGAQQKHGGGEEDVSYTENNALYALSRGFAVLAKHLAEIKANSELHLRLEGDYPEYHKYTTLQRFPFRHTVAYLDLLPEAQDRINSSLTEASRLLLAAEVASVRNEQLHFRRAPSDIGRLTRCLDAAQAVVSTFEEVGLSPLSYRLSRRQSDNWGRSTAVLANAQGSEAAFASPSSYRWLRLPSFAQPQILMPGAVFATPGEILRFTVGTPSAYSSFWSNYPSRRRRTEALSSPSETGMVARNAPSPVGRGASINTTPSK